MPRQWKWGCPLVVALSLAASTASAQYAVGHRTFGIGTSVGLGYSRMDYQFPDVEPGARIESVIAWDHRAVLYRREPFSVFRPEVEAVLRERHGARIADQLQAFAYMKLVFNEYYSHVGGLQYIQNPEGGDLFRRQQ